MALEQGGHDEDDALMRVCAGMSLERAAGRLARN